MARKRSSCGTGGDLIDSSGAARRVHAGAARAPARAPVIGFSQANGGDEWRTNQNNKVAENCQTPWPRRSSSDALGDDAVQSSHVDEFISRPVDVLLLTPNTAAGLTEAAKRALDKKIPVITLDRSVDVEVTQHIGADNKLIGRTAAEYVSKTILGGKGGKVIEIQGTPGASATTDRHDDFVKWLADNDPNVEIVDSVDRRLQARGRADGDERPAPEATARARSTSSTPTTTRWPSAWSRPSRRPAGSTSSRSSASTARTRRSRPSRTARSS